MSAEQTTSVVQRKARSGRDAQAARAMSLSRALRLTAAKQADRLMGLPLSALGVTRRTIGNDDVPTCLEAASLTLLMDGPGTQVAVAILDPVMVAGLIQQQTMGKLFAPSEGGETRKHTATDAALCAPFIEKLLIEAALLPDEEADCGLLTGYRFGVRAQEPRQAQLALEANDFTVIEMTLDMAAGTRTGKLVLILPKPVQAVVEQVSEDAPSKEISKTNLSENVMGLTAELMIALTRLRLPLQRVNSFAVGDLVDLNLSSMAQALVIDGNGRAIARGTLGQIDGLRAVQVEQQKKRQHTEPRRRAEDRDALDLPDVTAPVDGPPAIDAMRTEGLPSFGDMDVFGDLDDLPDLPDMDEAAQAADDQIADRDNRQAAQPAEYETDAARHGQAGW